jgi:hypothetical protein
MRIKIKINYRLNGFLNGFTIFFILISYYRHQLYMILPFYFAGIIFY